MQEAIAIADKQWRAPNAIDATTVKRSLSLTPKQSLGAVMDVRYECNDRWKPSHGSRDKQAVAIAMNAARQASDRHRYECSRRDKQAIAMFAMNVNTDTISDRDR